MSCLLQSLPMLEWSMECKGNVIVDFHPPWGAICSRWQARFQQPRRGEQEAERHTKKEVGVPYMAYKIRKVKWKRSDQSLIIPGTNKYKQYFAQAHYCGCHIWRHTCVYLKLPSRYLFSHGRNSRLMLMVATVWERKKRAGKVWQAWNEKRSIISFNCRCNALCIWGLQNKKNCQVSRVRVGKDGLHRPKFLES